MTGSAIIVSLRVAASPRRAFEVFTGEIGRWWQSDPFVPLAPGSDGTLAFEPGLGGRLRAFLADGSFFTVGEITVWEPGSRLALSWRQSNFPEGRSTFVEVRFEAVGDGTRVTVEHRGWDAVPAKHAARHGLNLIAFEHRAGRNWQRLLVRFAHRVEETRG